MLDQIFLEKCEEFLDQIVNENRDEELDYAMESLREFIETQVDGYFHRDPEGIAYSIQCRLEEVWGLVPASEKSANSDLSLLYDEMVAQLESISHFEAEKSDSSFFDDEDDEEYECENRSENAENDYNGDEDEDDQW